MPTPNQTHSIFINLPVKDIERSKAFFSKLGFSFNPQFTDEKAACMVLSEHGYVMLLSAPFFKTFTSRSICDTTTHNEALVALSCSSREEVKRMTKAAIEAGGSVAQAAVDHGFMYSESFYDLDGHHWEPLWMDPKAIEKSDTAGAS